MKILLTLLVLFFSSSVFAEDISDFEIEGISIRDSLLNHYSEEKINDPERIKKQVNYNDKFIQIGFREDLLIYDKISIVLKKSNRKFITKKTDKDYFIFSIRGTVYLDIDECHKQKVEVVLEISSLFKNIEKKEINKSHAYDKSGQSKTFHTVYFFPEGHEVAVTCTDWSKDIEMENGWNDALQVEISDKEYSYFINNEFYQ